MAIKKLGQLCGVNIVRIVNPVGVRVRCEFVSLKHPFVEFEIPGDLALGIAMELEMLLPLISRKAAPARTRRRVPLRKSVKRPGVSARARPRI
jgi:hypothetical protein